MCAVERNVWDWPPRCEIITPHHLVTFGTQEFCVAPVLWRRLQNSRMCSFTVENACLFRNHDNFHRVLFHNIPYCKFFTVDYHLHSTMAALVGADFLVAALGTLHSRNGLHLCQFDAIFGCSDVIAASLWRKLVREELLPERAQPHHLLWALAFLKIYGTEPTMCQLFKTTRKTWRQWVWPMIDALFYIDLVRWRCPSFGCGFPTHAT